MAEYYNPYEILVGKQGRWTRSCFHIHPGTGLENPSLSGESVMRVYKEAGYDLIMFSGQQSWEDTSALAEKVGIHSVNGTEYIEEDGLLLIGTHSFIGGSPQQALDECNRQGGIAVVCHPNWESQPGMLKAIPADVRNSLTGITGIEILTPCIFNRFLGSGYAVDAWDQMLMDGKVVWAFANDDAHHYFEMARAWVEIYGDENICWENIKQSILRGVLYCSTGLKLYLYELQGNILTVQADYPCQKQEKTTYRFIGENGRVLSESIGAYGRYEIRGSEKYIRVEARGESGHMLWTQPLLNRNFFSAPI